MHETGARVLTTLSGRSAASVERARHAGLEVIDDDDALVGEAAFVLSIVPPGQAEAVSERYRAPLSRAHEKPIFAECNAVAPATVRRIAESLASTGCRFIDAGIIGSPPPAGSLDNGPRFYACGVDARLLTSLRSYGLDVVIVEGPVGAASALKLSYAGITKGFIALGAAMIGGASRDGLASALREELARSQPGLLDWLGPQTTNMFHKAYRWVAEMEEIAEFLGDAGTGGAIYTGAARLFERIAAEREHSGDDAPLVAAMRSFFAMSNNR
jgi:3-hydroxyisobutyrate dehydrogenase-like beta-hydroxyacid dehydrogenase